MKRFFLAVVAMACWGMEPNASKAEELAATSVLPAALTGVSTGRDLVLTKTASARVRAQYVPTSGIRLVVNGSATYPNNSSIVYQFAAGGQSTTVAFTPTGLVFQAQGLAVIGTAPPIQGVIGANTNVFQGVIGFQGATSNLQVVALPDLFMIVSP